jgi:mannose-6-phosphate isomerase-like protein (cupin superfamily)
LRCAVHRAEGETKEHRFAEILRLRYDDGGGVDACIARGALIGRVTQKLRRRKKAINRQDARSMKKINLAQKLTVFQDYWQPKIVGDLNDSYVKLAKFKGEFIWHHHENEDELFLVVKGELLIKFRDSEVRVRPGEFIIVPKGIEHLPIAENEVHVLVIEPKSTLNTGNITDDRTVRHLERI